MSHRSRFYFLRRNSFFTSTPLTGYEFISQSKTLFETVIWYSVIILFSVAAGASMYEMVHYYRTYPTRTYVQTASRTDNISIGNISLQYKGSLSDFSEVIPMTLSFLEPTTHGIDYSAQYLLCNMRVPYYNLWKHWMMMHTWAEISAAMLKPFDQSRFTRARDFSTVEDLRVELKDFLLDDHYFEELPSSETDRSDLVDETQRIMNIGLKGNTNAFVSLAMLHAIKEDVDPREIFFNLRPPKHIFSYVHHHDFDYWRYVYILEKAYNILEESYDLFQQSVEYYWYEDEHASNKPTSMYKNKPKEILAHVSWTGSKLLEEIYKHLANIILVNTNGMASIVLADWTYGGERIAFESEVEEDLVWYLDGWHKLELIARPPSGIQKINIDIQLKAYNLMEAQRDETPNATYYRQPYAVYTKYCWEDQAYEYECGCEDRPEDKTHITGRVSATKLSEAMMDFIKQYCSLYIEIEGGNIVEIQPFYEYTLNLKPSSQFVSETKDCYEYSYSFCVNDCISGSTEEHCNCGPWYLQHQRKTVNVCDQPCPPVNETSCEEDCRAKSKQRCELTLFQIDYTRGNQKPYHDTERIFDITIQIAPVSNHAQFFEVYDMGRIELLTQLAAQMEFWIGLNILGMVHLLVYIIKQCIHLKDRRSDAALCMRGLCGRRQIAQEEQPNEESITSGTATEMKILALTNTVWDMKKQLATETAKLEKVTREMEQLKNGAIEQKNNQG